METVRPALVVVHGDMFHHVGKLVEIGRRIDIGAPAASDAVIDLRSDGANGGEHLVGRSKVVARGLFGIGTLVGKDDAGIARFHHTHTLRGVGNKPGEFPVGLFEF